MQVFIVNGNPRAGKDTFVAMVTEELEAFGIAAGAFSSIDPVRAVVAALNIDVTGKSEADRLLLSELGLALERHSMFRSKACVRFCLANPEPVKFLFIREPSVMRVVHALLTEADGPDAIHVRRLLVTRPDAPALISNPADAAVRSIRYDIEIANDADLAELQQVARSLALYIVQSGFAIPAGNFRVIAASRYDDRRAA